MRVALAPAMHLLLAVFLAIAPPVETDDYILTTVAKDVYTIRHKRAVRMGAASGNTTVIIGERDVLVVDSCLLPMFARDDIALIRKWTDKPVRYLVNTHWHGDHTWGNGVYYDTFPGLTIIAHTETAKQMAYLPAFIKQNIGWRDFVKKAFDSGKDFDGSPLTAERRKEIEDDLPNADLRVAEYKTLVTRFPNLTFDRELNLDLGHRRVQILHLGRGNTAGDAVVYLPDEKVVVAGDMLVYPRPYLLGGFPHEWSETLDRVAALGVETIVPGHGAVQSGTEFLLRVRDMLRSVSDAVREEMYKNWGEHMGGAHLDAIREAVIKRPDVATWRKRFAGDDEDLQKWFDHAIARVVESSYREEWGK